MNNIFRVFAPIIVCCMISTATLWAAVQAPLPALKDASPASPTLASPVSAEERTAFLKRFDAELSKLKGLEAEFTQRKYSKIFDQEDTSTGILLYSQEPRRLLWHYQKPEELYLMVENNKLQILNPEINQLQVFIKPDLSNNDLFLTFGQPSSELLKRYDLELTPAEGGMRKVTLTPKEEETKAFFRMVELWVKEDSALPNRIRIVNNEQEETDITFSKDKINPEQGAAKLVIPTTSKTRIIEKIIKDTEPKQPLP